METISIYDEGKIIELYTGYHKVRILGSWLVLLNNFKVYLKEINNGKIIKCKNKMIYPNDYINGKKAKIIGDFDIVKGGKFSVHFENPFDIKVIYIGRFGLGLLSSKKIRNKDIEIVIGE